MKNLLKFLAMSLTIAIVVIVSVWGFVNYGLYTVLSAFCITLIAFLVYKSLQTEWRDEIISWIVFGIIAVIAGTVVIYLFKFAIEGTTAAIDAIAPAVSEKSGTPSQEIALGIVLSLIFAIIIFIRMRAWIKDCRRQAEEQKKSLTTIVLYSIWNRWLKAVLCAIAFIAITGLLIWGGLELFIL